MYLFLLCSLMSFAAAPEKTQIVNDPNEKIIAQIAAKYNSAKSIGDLEKLIEPALTGSEFKSISERIRQEHVSSSILISPAVARANQLYVGPSTLILTQKGFSLNGMKIRKNGRAIDRMFGEWISDPHMHASIWWIEIAAAAESKLEKIPGALAAVIAVKHIYQ